MNEYYNYSFRNCSVKTISKICKEDTQTILFIKFIIWLVFNLVGIIIAQLSTRKYYCDHLANNSWFASWIIFHTDAHGRKYFKIGVNPMKPFQRVRYWVATLHLILIMFYYGDIPNKIHSVQDMYYLFWFLMIPFFGFIGQTRALHDFVLTPTYLKNLSYPGKMVIFSLCGLASTLLVYHLIIAYNREIIMYYSCGIIGLPIFYMILYKYWLEDQNKFLYSDTFVDLDIDSTMLIEVDSPDSRASWHIHHWFVGFYFSLLFRFNTTISKLAFMGFYMVFLEGVFIEGPISIIT